MENFHVPPDELIDESIIYDTNLWNRFFMWTECKSTTYRTDSFDPRLRYYYFDERVQEGGFARSGSIVEERCQCQEEATTGSAYGQEKARSFEFCHRLLSANEKGLYASVSSKVRDKLFAVVKTTADVKDRILSSAIDSVDSIGVVLWGWSQEFWKMSSILLRY